MIFCVYIHLVHVAATYIFVAALRVLLQNGGFCNGFITERGLHNSRKVSYDLVSQFLDDKKLIK